MAVWKVLDGILCLYSHSRPFSELYGFLLCINILTKFSILKK